MARKWRLIEYRDDTVKHTTSPSRRGSPRQGVDLLVFQIRPRPDFKSFRAAKPCTLSSSTLNPLARSASGAAVVVGRCVSPEARASVLRLRKFRHRTTILISL